MAIRLRTQMVENHLDDVRDFKIGLDVIVPFFLTAIAAVWATSWRVSRAVSEIQQTFAVEHEQVKARIDHITDSAVTKEEFSAAMQEQALARVRMAAQIDALTGRPR